MGSEDQIELIKVISERSSIYKCKKSNELYLGKHYDKSLEEIKILERCSKSDYISLIRFYSEYNNEIIYLQTFYPYGNIHSKLAMNKGLPRGQIQNIAKQLLLGIDFLHKNSVIHRNINLKSIICTSNDTYFDIKLAGFSHSKFYDPKKPPTEKCGEIGYMPPEMIKGKPQSYKSDIWMYGITLYRLLAETNYPFRSDKNLGCIKRMKQGMINYQFPNFISQPLAKDFIKLILKYKHDERPQTKTLFQNFYLTVAEYNSSRNSKVPYIQFRI